MHAPDIPQLAEAIDRDRILRARALDPATKIAESLDWYDECLKVMRSGIRQQYPSITPEDEHAELQRRLRIAHHCDDVSYRPVESSP